MASLGTFKLHRPANSGTHQYGSNSFTPPHEIRYRISITINEFLNEIRYRIWNSFERMNEIRSRIRSRTKFVPTFLNEFRSIRSTNNEFRSIRSNE